MGLVLKIAWRNILRHKGKSLVVGIILFMGAFMLTMGNGFLSGMNNGLAHNLVQSFSGNIVICPTNQKPDDCLIGDPMSTKSPKIIAGYTNIRSLLRSHKEVVDFTPICRGMAMALSEDGDPAMTMLYGVKFDEYQRVFRTNIRQLEGRALKPMERGILITSNSRKELYEYTSYWFKPEGEKLNTNHMSDSVRSNLAQLLVRTNMVIMGLDSEGLARDIRIPVKGVFKYSQFNSVWDRVSIMDIESFRECFNYITGQDAHVNLSKDQETLLSASTKNLDDMFNEGTVSAADTTSQSYDLAQFKVKKKVMSTPVDVDAGEYNLVLIKLVDGANTKKMIALLNKEFKTANMDAKAIPWDVAVKRVAQMAALIRIILYFFVGLLYLVAIIIIMNTLSMAALERTTEIGMMRAVGAKKRFIQDMFVGETVLLSAFFGGLGIVFGVGVTVVLAIIQFKASNQWAELLFGGNVFHPMFTAGDIVWSVLFLAFATVLALIYPVIVARRITPLEAIARD